MCTSSVPRSPAPPATACCEEEPAPPNADDRRVKLARLAMAPVAPAALPLLAAAPFTAAPLAAVPLVAVPLRRCESSCEVRTAALSSAPIASSESKPAQLAYSGASGIASSCTAAPPPPPLPPPPPPPLPTPNRLRAAVLKPVPTPLASCFLALALDGSCCGWSERSSPSMSRYSSRARWYARSDSCILFSTSMICCTLVRISRKSRPSSRGTVGGGRLGRKPQHKTHDASSASEKRPNPPSHRMKGVGRQPPT
mmetsp:Transcript_73545/g.221021  ORF Transcript_73545/g.221021 Transcript_73545/m.221021 type:complete len:254 (-) Transcript_73545:210-971(-)